MGIYDKVSETNKEISLPKTFSSTIGFIQYSIKSILISLGLLIYLYFRFSQRYENVNLYLILFLILMLIGIYYRYQKYVKNSKYTFEKDKIIWDKNGKSQEFLYDDIIDISTPNEKTKKVTNQDFLKLKFTNNRKLSFMSTDPNYFEIKALISKIYAHRNRKFF